MLSCVAIQKLERYGQLAQKRKSVDDFVSSSLRDPKRSNIHALTHTPTWQACLSALDPDSSSNRAGTERDGEASQGTESVGGTHCTVPSRVAFSESLLYAVSYATSLIVRHMDELRFSWEGDNEEAMESVSLEGKVFATRLKEAAELHQLLWRVSRACARHIKAHTGDSSQMVQALLHLLSSALDSFLVVSVLRHSATCSSEEDIQLVNNLCRSSTGLVVAVGRQFRVMQPNQTCSALHTVRPCPTLLTQYLARAGAGRSDSAKCGKRGEPTGNTCDNSFRPYSGDTLLGSRDVISDDLVTTCFFEWTQTVPSGLLLVSLGSFSAFQKVSFCDAMVSEAPPYCCCMNVHSFRRALSLLLGSAACNRATRIVVYFRGDDIKLMQNNVRDSAEYSMHTHVTTPPAERSTLCCVAKLPPAQQHHAILLMAGWIASIPLFFRSFCAEESWTVFAQEQRRLVWLRERDKRQERGNKRRGSSSANSITTAGGDGGDSVSTLSGDGHFEADDYAGDSISMSNQTPSNHTREHGQQYNADSDEDRHSATSQLSSFSLMSRASILSTLSRPSVDSYRTFLSVIDASNTNNSRANAAPCLRQSEDDNTNLPLILLEEMILGLQRFLLAAEEASTDRDLLETTGLRALVWRTIGELFTFVQSTISFSSTKLTVKATPPVFHLGNDLRYNRGLGYEVLGLLFAKVVLPQLHASSQVTGNGTRSVVERALTRCLSTYEMIAPQVIDQNVRAILRIACRVSHTKKSEVLEEDQAEVLPATILQEFLISLVTRLGKSNQICMLLDAVVSHVAEEGEDATYREGGMDDKVNPLGNVAGDLVVAGLQNIFTSPDINAALIEACSISLDPERLLLRLLSYVVHWASEEEDGEGSANDDQVVAIGEDEKRERVKATLSRMEPQGVLFVLDLVSTVLSGVTPTSISAATILERAAELELALSTFYVNKLHKTFIAGVQHGEEQSLEQESSGTARSMKQTDKVSLFACSNGAVSPKEVRRLVLHTLNAVYNARALILSCLQDLGVSNLDAYLQLLEESMWNLQRQVDALVGPLTLGDLHASVSMASQVRYARSARCPLLLPRLALQRLTLARSVSMALNFAVGSASTARSLGAGVLSYMMLESEGGVVPDGQVDLALSLADALTEEEWRSLTHFTKAKRVRTALVLLLQHSFTRPRALEWLTRCVAACGGPLVEALCDVLMAVDDSELIACCNSAASKGKENGVNPNECDNTSIIRLLAAINDVLGRIGRIQQWLPVLQRFVHWLLTIYKEERDGECGSTVLEQHLLRFVLNILVCEEGVQPLFRWVLTREREQQTEEGHHLGHQRSRKNERRSGGVNEDFMELVGTSFTVADAIRYYSTRYKSEDGADGRAEGGRAEIARQGVEDCTTLVRKIFSRKFVTLLIKVCCAKKCGCDPPPQFGYALGILRRLYTIALTVCQHGSQTTENCSLAHNFLIIVADKMHECLYGGNYVVISTFLDVMDGSRIIYIREEQHRRASSGTGAPAKRLRVENMDGIDGNYARNAGRKYHRFTEDASEKGEIVAIGETPDAAKECPSEECQGNQKDSGENVEATKSNELSQRWVSLLGNLLQDVVRELVDEHRQPLSFTPLLHAMTSLYFALERVQLAKPNNMVAAECHRRKGVRAEKRERTYENQQGKGGRTAASLAVVSSEFSGAAAKLRKLFAPFKSASRRNSASVLLPLLGSCDQTVLRAMWVLYAVYEECWYHILAGGSAAGELESQQTPQWFAAVLRNFDVHERRNYRDANSDATNRLLQEAQGVVSQPGGRHGALRVTALQKEPPYKTEEATVWLSGQLRIMPEVLRLFTAGPTHALLLEYTHALFHASVSLSPAAWRSSKSFQGRHERLLTVVAEVLYRLSSIPHLRFGVWRNDVKRLLVSAGAAAELASNGDKHDCSCTHNLCSRVLQLCALPLASLHDDDTFVDHELNFIASLLFDGAGRHHYGPHHLPEDVILRVIRLLSATLLPRGALWRRAHLLPTTLSTLFARCLDGVSHGSCTRVVLNQFSSLLYQLVKDAAHGHCKGVSCSLKSLCLSSITSCLFRQSAAYIDVFTTHSSDLDYIAVDLLKALQRVHLPPRLAPSLVKKFYAERGKTCESNKEEEENDDEEEHDATNQSGATMCDLSYACVGNTDAQMLLRQAAERVEEEEGNSSRHIFLLPE